MTANIGYDALTQDYLLLAETNVAVLYAKDKNIGKTFSQSLLTITKSNSK